jgi:predicted CXXCH cytochrome family protein
MTLFRYVASLPAAVAISFLVSTAKPADQQTAEAVKSPSAFENGTLSGEGRREAGVFPEDPGERAAFAALIAETDQRRRREMAARFVVDYPQSWMLAPAYEILSKSSLALGDLAKAMEFGANSLRIQPENPFLLLALADARTKAGDYSGAEQAANDAVWYLQRFDRASSIDPVIWPKLKVRFEAEGHFDSGRAAAAEGFASQGERRKQRLEDARRYLMQSLSFNAGGAGAAVLLGMVELGLERPADAAASFAWAAKADGPPHDQAMNQLRAIYSDLSISAGRPFEAWVASLKLSLPEPPDTPKRAPGKMPQYVGSEVCRECHPAQHAAWKSTGMGRMFRPWKPGEVMGDFTSGQTVNGNDGKPAARAFLVGGRPYIGIRQGDRWAQYPVQYLIGSKWQQGYATTLPGGEIQVFPLQYNRLEKRWVNYWKTIDAPDSERTDITRFHDALPGATHQLNCAPCHISQERFAGGVMQASAASFRESGVNCEMCHGPSATHVAAMHAGRPYKKDPAEPPVDFKRIGAQEFVQICAQCHMQSGERNPEAGGAMNYSETGPTFYRVLSSRPFVDYSRRAFYKDGRFRETVFIVESFERSACFRKGGATCGNCHNPHPDDAAENPTSLKFRVDPDRMCIGCHKQFEPHLEAHTHHPASGEASRCVSCHMPRIMNALLFKARSHQIDDVPDAAMTARFGASDSPNACLICHTDKNSDWLMSEMEKWKKGANLSGKASR